MSPSYYRKLRERRHDRAMAGVRGRERKRAAETLDGPDWTRTKTLLIAVYAHRDGRHAGLYINGHCVKVGTERAMRAALARELWE